MGTLIDLIFLDRNANVVAKRIAYQEQIAGAEVVLFKGKYYICCSRSDSVVYSEVNDAIEIY